MASWVSGPSLALGRTLEPCGSVVSEFRLPIEITIAGSRTSQRLDRLLSECTRYGAVAYLELLNALNQKRQDECSLPEGLVVAFDADHRCLRDENPYKPNKPPEWGWTAEGGLILIRLTRDQPLHNLVQHEMGHLPGIRDHHSDCVNELEVHQGGVLRGMHARDFGDMPNCGLGSQPSSIRTPRFNSRSKEGRRQNVRIPAR